MDEPAGWGEDDWSDEKVREDLWGLLRQVAERDGAPEPVVEERLRRVRMWAAIEAARTRARPPTLP